MRDKTEKNVFRDYFLSMNNVCWTFRNSFKTNKTLSTAELMQITIQQTNIRVKGNSIWLHIIEDCTTHSILHTC